jgi:hypothetical protein
MADEPEEAAKAAPPPAISAKEKPSILEALRQGAERSRQMFGDKPAQEKKPEVCI